MVFGIIVTFLGGVLLIGFERIFLGKDVTFSVESKYELPLEAQGSSIFIGIPSGARKNEAIEFSHFYDRRDEPSVFSYAPLSNENRRDNVTENIQYPIIEIDLTGSNNDLILSRSTSLASATQSVNILGSNLDREISIPIGQIVSLTISGSNNEVNIDESIFSQISISEFGSNNNILKSK